MLRYHGRMIAHLFGTVRGKHESHLVLDVQGVGYKVYCIGRLLTSVNKHDELGVHTHLAVREDAMDLFGFAQSEELELFKLLIGVSGIGPRSALGIIGLESIDKLTTAIAHNDVAYLTKVSGVGKKSAEKICLELKDKVGVLNIEDVAAVRREEEDVLEALQALGYRLDEAREALRTIPDDVVDPGARVKEALRVLSQ